MHKTSIFKRQALVRHCTISVSAVCILSEQFAHLVTKIIRRKVSKPLQLQPRKQHAHTTMPCLPAQGSNRFPWGNHWNRWKPTSEMTPEPAALCAAAPPDGTPACWGCTVSLQSLIYRYIFLSYHTVVTQSPGDCSHIAHRIASLSPTTYWALKPKRRKNKKTRQSWAYGIIQVMEAGVFWNFLLKASLTSENDLLVVNNKMYLCERSPNWQALMNLNTGQGYHWKQILKTTFSLME